MSLMMTHTNQETMLAWASARLGAVGAWGWGVDADAVAIVEKETGRITMVMVLNAFFEDSCYAHMISDGKHGWATPGTLKALFGYAFDYRCVSRIIGITPAHNIAAVAAAVKMGFQIEGRVRSTPDGQKANIVSTMFREECRWIGHGGSSNG